MLAWVLSINLCAFLTTAAAQSGWPLVGTIEPGAASFEFRHARKGIYHIRITVDPKITFLPRRKVLNLDLTGDRIRKKEIERLDPGGLALNWEIDLSEIEFPYYAISKVRAVFDSATIEVLGASLTTYEFKIPDTATKLERVEIEFKWLENEALLNFQASVSGFGSFTFTPFDPRGSIEEALPLQFVRLRAKLQTDPGTEPLPELVIPIKNRRTMQEIAVKLAQVKAGERVFTSPLLLLAVEGADPQTGPELPVCPGDLLEASFAGDWSILKVAEPDESLDIVPCSLLPNQAKLTFEALSSLSSMIDPQGGQSGKPLRVRLLDERSRPLVDEEIVWRFPGLGGRAVTTFTDERGEAELHFSIEIGGIFAVTVDGLATDIALGDGEWEVEAVPHDPLIASLAAGAPLTFKVDLVLPTTLRLIDRQGRPMPVLLNESEFFAQMRLGRRDAAASAGTHTLPLAIASQQGAEEVDTIPVQAEKTAVKDTYETKTRTFAVVRGAPLRTGEIVAADRGQVTISLGRTTLTVPFYKDQWSKTEVETVAVLEFWRDALGTALKSRGLLPEEREILQLRMRLTENAFAWLQEPHPDNRHRYSVAQRYLELIPADVGTLGEPIDRAAANSALPTSLQSTAMRFVSSEEARLVTTALVEVSGLSAASILAIPSSIGGNVSTFITSLPETLLSPAFGVYTAVTGWTADGQVATGLERLLGGVDGALTVLGAVGSAAKFASFARAARAFGLRAALSEVAVGPLTFGDLVEGSNSRGGLIVSVESEIASEAVQNAKAAKGLGKIQVLTKSAERSGKLLEKFNEQASAARRQLKTLEQELSELENKLRRAEAAGTTRTKVVKREIAAKKRRIERTVRRAEKFAEKVERHSLIKEKADLALGRIAKKELSSPQLTALRERGELPRARDQIKGKMAQEQYENQVNTQLAQEGYQAGSGVTLNTAYPSPLGEGFGAPASRGSRRATKAPVMDHINKVALDVADSKYYDFKGATAGSERALKAAREIADTVEKGRLVQTEKVRARRSAAHLPLDEESIIQEVCQKKVTIVTPTKMPPHIQELIKLFVGKRSATNLLFRTIPADTLKWTE